MAESKFTERKYDGKSVTSKYAGKSPSLSDTMTSYKQKGNEATVTEPQKATKKEWTEKKYKAGGEVKKFKLFGGAESKAEEKAEKKSVKSKKAYDKKEKSEPGEKFACGGAVKKAKGGSIDGVAQRGKTVGKFV